MPATQQLTIDIDDCLHCTISQLLQRIAPGYGRGYVLGALAQVVGEVIASESDVVARDDMAADFVADMLSRRDEAAEEFANGGGIGQ